MSDIEKRMKSYEASEAVKRLNPHLYEQNQSKPLKTASQAQIRPSGEQIKSHETNNINNSRKVSHSELQERQEDMGKESGNKARGQTTNEANTGRYKITVDFFMSDNRRRDLDGMLATILDCLCTERRLLAGDTFHFHKFRGRTKRQRRL